MAAQGPGWGEGGEEEEEKNAKLTLQKQDPQGWIGYYCWERNEPSRRASGCRWETGPSLRVLLGPGCVGLGESTLHFKLLSLGFLWDAPVQGDDDLGLQRDLRWSLR